MVIHLCNGTLLRYKKEQISYTPGNVDGYMKETGVIKLQPTSLHLYDLLERQNCRKRERTVGTRAWGLGECLTTKGTCGSFWGGGECFWPFLCWWIHISAQTLKDSEPCTQLTAGKFKIKETSIKKNLNSNSITHTFSLVFVAQFPDRGINSVIRCLNFKRIHERSVAQSHVSFSIKEQRGPSWNLILGDKFSFKFLRERSWCQGECTVYTYAARAAVREILVLQFC